jgi:hypothetical protein
MGEFGVPRSVVHDTYLLRTFLSACFWLDWDRVLQPDCRAEWRMPRQRFIAAIRRKNRKEDLTFFVRLRNMET